jgi:tetratricopeptide (TPR) repeat protein
MDASGADVVGSPAVRLFLERVRDAQPGFRLIPASSPIVEAICRRLDALPLALELAAPWLKVLTPEALLQRLDRDVLLSHTGSRDLPERQRTINATVAWSYQLLDDDDKRVFRHLGALPGRFSIDAAAAVLDESGTPPDGNDVLAAAARLIDKSLLVRVDAPRPLYTMLETIRAYAGLELDAAGEREAALDGLARYCRAEASLAGEQLAGPAQGEWLDRVHDDLDNYRAAMSWLVAGGRGADACDIAWGLIFFWLIRGHQAEGLEWYERILNTPDLPPAAEAKALIGASMIWHTHGNRSRARVGLTRALSLDVGNAELIAIAENVFGHLEHADGNFDAARARFTRSLATFRDSGIAWATGNALIGMAAVALATGNVADAERRLDEATSVLERAGPWFLNLPLYIRAILAVRQGDAGRAIGFAGASLRCSRQLHDRFAFVYALTPLAVAAGLKGDDVWAARILGARDAVMERTGVSLSEMALQQLRERIEREGRTRLGPVRWARARAAGRNLSIDALLKDLAETPQ